MQTENICHGLTDSHCPCPMHRLVGLLCSLQRATQGATAKVPLKSSGASADALVASVAGFLHCRVVMREKKKAASLYGVFPSGDVVCALVKLREAHVTIDVKCSQASHASSIAKELKALSL